MVQHHPVNGFARPNAAAAPRSGAPVASRANGSTNDSTATTYSNYLFGQAGENDRPLLSDTTKGRIFIRLLSRGIFGAIAFAWGTRVADAQLKHYEPETWTFNSAKPLQTLAKGFDATFGRAIQGVARAFAPENQKDLWAYESTRFRSKAYFHGFQPNQHGIGGAGLNTGRTLGAEMVGVTFNFAMASIADSTVRNIIQAIDPNNKKAWVLDKNGNASGKWWSQDVHYDYGKWMKAVGNASWRILSKNQGEDWAAALPYVYQMKWQRQWIANHFPNFKLSADNSWNGASYLVNNQGDVVGDLKAAGTIDLWTRFVGYNWYTLMYREAYDMVAYKFGQWKKDGITMPHLGNPVEATVHALGSGSRYVLKSFLKANLYMQPAMAFFAPMRVAQSAWRAGSIGIDVPVGTNAIMTRNSMSADLNALGLAANGTAPVPQMERSYWKNRDAQGNLIPELEYRYATAGKTSRLGMDHTMWLGNHQLPLNSEIGRATSPFDSSLQKSTFSKIINPLGKFSYKAGSFFNGIFNGRALSDTERLTMTVKQIEDWERKSASNQEFIRNTVDAATSYTPYMIAKAEFAYRVDERPSGHELGEMDKSLYHFIDSIFSFDVKGVCKSIGNIGYHALRTKEHLSGREGGRTAPVTMSPTTRVQSSSIQHALPAEQKKAANSEDPGNNDNTVESWAEKQAHTRHSAPRYAHG